MLIKKELDKRAMVIRNKAFTRHLQRQNTNQIFIEHVITINEMGQNENAVGISNNSNFWNRHLCGVNGYLIVVALWFIPILITTSFEAGIDWIVTGEMFDFWSSASKLDKMLMKDCFMYSFINGLYPSLIYINNDKLRRHVKEEFF